MRSSGGEHFLALDQIRAVAALMVFSWHFTHAANGYPTPFAGAPMVFPLALFDEGHTGVSLFMTLSGYLFAKLLAGREIHFSRFLWNRLLRLAPLLALVVAITVARRIHQGGSPVELLAGIASGLITPTLPNGGWSITVEGHFYLLLPMMRRAFRRYGVGALVFLLIPIALRTAIFVVRGESQWYSYWTIVGRIDQFALGMAAFQMADLLRRRHLLALCVALAFAAFYWSFDARGGFYQMPSYPSSSALWIIMPTIEGAAYALLVAYYDASFTPRPVGFSRLLGKAGAYSYSIYLLHYFVVFRAADLVHRHVMDLSNWYVAQCWAIVCFALMVPVGHLSFRYIEAPFLRFRSKYIVPAATLDTAHGASAQPTTRGDVGVAPS